MWRKVEQLILWLVLVGAILIMVSVLSGCMRKGDPAIPGDRGRNPSAYISPAATGGVPIWVDPETGCQYLGWTGSGFITPRLGADGKPICVKLLNPVTGQ